MADEGVYSSGGSESHKRKYDDSTSPAGGVAKGFSSSRDAVGPPSSYKNVPPPLTEFELAKQKAQEIAARLLNSADPLKRARVDNGIASGGGFDSIDYGSQRSSGFSYSGPTQALSTGYSSSSKKIEVPNGRVGVIIGRGGETIKYLQIQSGAKIQVTRDMDADPNSTTRSVELVGTPDQIAKAEQLISDVLSEAEAGASGGGSRRLSGPPPGAEQFVMKIPNNKVGLVIGKGGETIKNMQASTGARIQVIPLHLPPGDMSRERTVQIDGTSEQIEAAKQFIEEVTSENRGRNSSMSGGYSQQGYQARPPSNWGPPGPPTQQPGYGYVQPGAYPGPPSQYMNQSSYAGYAQPPNSGGYSGGWDQSSTPQNQQSAQGGGYDYYSQQPQPHQGGPGAPVDVSGYGYGQYGQGQGYAQDGYGYSSGAGYGQSQTGYDQQQQGYNSSYGGGSNNPASDGTLSSYGTQVDANQTRAPGQPIPSYQSQAAQPGYAQPHGGYGSYAPPPQGHKPSGGGEAAYGQPQQSPSAKDGYSQGKLPQAAPAQPAAAAATNVHSDSGAQRPPASGYQVSQQGYAGLPYGAQPTSQAGYGQQFNAYGGGYAQPPPYSSDASAGVSGRVGYETTPPPPPPPPPSQSTQPSATSSAKTSPAS